MEKETECGFLVKQLHDHLEKRANNALRDSGMTMMQMGVLKFLQDKDEPVSMKEIEHHFQIAQPTTTGIVRRLLDKGMVENETDTQDRRIRLISLTERGRECCKEGKTHQLRQEEILLKGFTGEEKKLFRAFLERALQNTK